MASAVSRISYYLKKGRSEDALKLVEPLPTVSSSNIKLSAEKVKVSGFLLHISEGRLNEKVIFTKSKRQIS